MSEWQSGKDSLARQVSQGQDDSRFLFCFSLHLLIFGLEKKVIFLFTVILAIPSLWPPGLAPGLLRKAPGSTQDCPKIATFD